ncbi:MAG: nucleotide exchange factor GrpE [Planctomycetes bacterium]|nr:nucleotide exchange factor GrpE [Planctomycetota bacterium]
MEPNKSNEPPASVAGESLPATSEVAPLVVGGPAVDPVAPPADPPVAEPVTEPSPEERDQLIATVEAARGKFLALLRADAKPKSPDVMAAATAYAAALNESQIPLAEEWSRLQSGVDAETAVGHTSECDKLRNDADRLIANYAALFAGLPVLEQAVVTELDRMKEDDPPFLAAPAEIREPLINYKKGLQIIQRMFGRLHARKKPLEGIAPLPPAPTLPNEAPSATELANKLTEFGHAVNDWRVAGNTTQREIRKKVDGLRKEVTGFVSALLGPIDGIEGGLRNEPELLGRLESFRSDHAAVIDGWTRAYERLDAGLLPYFEATGLSSLTVEPGSAFRPETMEPGGTVVRLDRPLEEVVSVMRRGYALNGEQLRPVQVEVVVHTASETPE